MKDDIKAGEQLDQSRPQLYEDYVKWYLRCADVRPCHEACLLDAAARYLLREPEPRGAFTVFPLYQALREGGGSLSTDCRKLLSALIKATELLETLCVNLFLQPWKKEIKTLKTFTGPFVYCLLPVFSSSTLQSVLASIGYLPHADTPQSEYRLSEDVNPDRAMQVGFEMLLARVECSHLLELLDKDQLGPQEWMELLQRRAGPTKPETPTERTTTAVPKEEEEEEKEEADRKEVPPYMESRVPVNPLPKPRRCHLMSDDQSIMEMQRNYPDLAFRGRPLLPDKPQRANSSRSSRKAAGTNNSSNDSRAAELHRRDCIKEHKAAASNIHSRNDGGRAAEVSGDDGRDVDQAAAPGDTVSSSLSNTDGGRADDELSRPQAVSLHITLRAGSTADQRLKPGETQPTAEPPAWTQQPAAADVQNKRAPSPGPPSLSSLDEERELRELAEKMGQLHVHEAREGTKRKEETTGKERRRKERKLSAEKKTEEGDLGKPTMETGAAASHAASRRSRSSQSDPAAVKEQKQPAVSTADCQSVRGGGTGRQDRDDAERAETGRGAEEQLVYSYVLL